MDTATVADLLIAALGVAGAVPCPVPRRMRRDASGPDRQDEAGDERS